MYFIADRSEVYADDPGAGCPEQVLRVKNRSGIPDISNDNICDRDLERILWNRAVHSASVPCALNEGELQADGYSDEDYELSRAQYQWIEKISGEVADFLYARFS